jgi:hypothetical protein
MTHSPGPWEAKTWSDSDDIPIYAADRNIVANVCADLELDDEACPGVVQENNAQLISNAPALLAELQQAELVIRDAVQKAAGLVKAKIVGGWEYHADRCREVINNSTRWETE